MENKEESEVILANIPREKIYYPREEELESCKDKFFEFVGLFHKTIEKGLCVNPEIISYINNLIKYFGGSLFL